MIKNEQTSERVASIAAKILEMKNPVIITDEFWKDIQSVAGTALTQTPDKPKPSLPLSAGYQPFKGLNPQLFQNLKNLKK